MDGYGKPNPIELRLRNPLQRHGSMPQHHEGREQRPERDQPPAGELGDEQLEAHEEQDEVGERRELEHGDGRQAGATGDRGEAEGVRRVARRRDVRPGRFLGRITEVVAEGLDGRLVHPVVGGPLPVQRLHAEQDRPGSSPRTRYGKPGPAGTPHGSRDLSVRERDCMAPSAR